MLVLAFFVTLVFIFSLVSRRIQRLNISGPMIFLLVSSIYFFSGLAVVQVSLGQHTILLVGEITLVLVLFTDASRLNLRSLRGSAQFPARMLLIGLPLTIIAGGVIAKAIFPSIDLGIALILGTILAPTDAGLGQAVVNDSRVPSRIRQALNVESGLNDGISVPFLMLFIALAEAEAGFRLTYWARFALEQIGFGTLVGIILGWLGGWLLREASRREWIIPEFQQISLTALAIITWWFAGAVGGNGFIAAFVAGLTTGSILKGAYEHLGEFTETTGQLLNLFLFFILGATVAQMSPQMNWLVIVYAIFSLTLIRMIPIAVSLIGTHLQPISVSFLGWFGPRGLASLVLGLVYLEEVPSYPGRETILLAVIATVFLSVFAHGLTASPLSRLYAQKVKKMDVDAPERRVVFVPPTRKKASI